MTLEMSILSAQEPLPDVGEGGDGVSVISYNILLPNSIGGWWIYKNYRPSVPESAREWAHRGS